MNAARLEILFNGVFATTCNTVLCGGASEPLYSPACREAPAQINYREDFASSALHEVAHWCIAGAARRRQVDYGYWYSPDGRSRSKQSDFERVEARPQALEWLFAQSCGAPFSLSLDNLAGDSDPADRLRFAREVVRQAETFLSIGLPPRAGRFCEVLRQDVQGGMSLRMMTFSLRDIL
ncbi:MAG: elongation factor P hydroxylase [Chromatocurvus sp.]